MLRMVRFFPLLLLPIAACQTNVVISEAKAERTAADEIVVRFRADQDLEETGLSVFGYFLMPPEAGVHLPGRWNAASSLQPQPGNGSTEFAYWCRIPAKAEKPGDFRVNAADGKPCLGTVDLPYDLSTPSDLDFQFYVVGGGCGFRGLSSNVVTLRLPRP